MKNGFSVDKKDTDAVEIWGGAEYTIVRVDNSVYDQLALSGHDNRPTILTFSPT